MGIGIYYSYMYMYIRTKLIISVYVIIGPKDMETFGKEPPPARRSIK
jgi:hypothetical protein